MQKCFAPSEYITNNRLRSAIGKVVEWRISVAYCAAKGGCKLFDPKKGGPGLDYQDVYRGPHPCNDFAEYLAKHNWWLDEVAIGEECRAPKEPEGPQFAVPDLVSHTAAGTGEFYEIKPASVPGRRKGREKIDAFNDAVARHGLPYAAGRKYRPDRFLLFWDATWQGYPVKLYIHWWLETDGLILYEFCMDSGEKYFSEVFVKMIVGEAIVVLFLIGLGEIDAVLVPALRSAASPMRSPLGPPDGVPAIDDPASLFYADLLTLLREERRGHPWPAEHLFVAVVAGSDPVEAWEPGDPRPWVWDAATMAAIGDIAPDGRFEPGGDAIRALEEDQLRWSASCLVEEEYRQSFTGFFVGRQFLDEEGDGGIIDAEELPAEAITACLESISEEMEYMLSHDGQW
ncbi:hypothetical protein ACFWZ2_14925 [Streptomyces sp. NPDC059002]|uniref:hypothetical protein n=1 Tax=Streptomyces sp. NPDC059002 TaxID=3346690 RepID=UPI0036AC33F0